MSTMLRHKEKDLKCVCCDYVSGVDGEGKKEPKKTDSKNSTITEKGPTFSFGAPPSFATKHATVVMNCNLFLSVGVITLIAVAACVASLYSTTAFFVFFLCPDIKEVLVFVGCSLISVVFCCISIPFVIIAVELVPVPVGDLLLFDIDDDISYICTVHSSIVGYIYTKPFHTGHLVLGGMT
jgi:hypothetical protein